MTEASEKPVAILEREADEASLYAWDSKNAKRRRLLVALLASLAAHASLLWTPALTAKVFSPPLAEETKTLQVALADWGPPPAEVPESVRPEPATQPTRKVLPPSQPTADTTAATREKSPECPPPYHYFRSREVEQLPVPLSHVDRNPVELLRHSDAGTLQADLCIDPTGTVSAVIVVATELPAVFTASATRHFSSVRFKPAVRNGEPVAVRQRISVRYEPPTDNPLAEKVTE